MKENKLKWAKVRENATIPTRDKGNAGYDIYPCFDEEYILINPNETKLVSTGIASAISEDYYLQIQERGSTGSKGIKYSAGVIDSSYRGEWFLAVTNTNDIPVLIAKNTDIELVRDKDGEVFVRRKNNPDNEKDINILIKDCIIYPYEKALFQAIVHKVHNELIEEEISYEELKAIKSDRGDGKLGSSGKWWSWTCFNDSKGLDQISFNVWKEC